MTLAPDTGSSDEAEAWKARALAAESKLRWAQERVAYFARRLDEMIGEVPEEQTKERG